MNPRSILLFIVLVLLSLFILTFFSVSHTTEKGEQDGFIIGNVTIKYPTATHLLEYQPVKEEKKLQLQKPSSLEAEIHTQREQEVSDSIAFFSRTFRKDLDTNAEGKIFYPGIPTNFIKLLRERLEKKTCQIIHYGDSKIEGDRITSYLRNKLQLFFGGSGLGFFPIKMVYNQKSIDLEVSENWRRYAAFDRKQKILKHASYGLYASLSRFTPYADETTDTLRASDTLTVKKAYLTIRPSRKFYHRLQQYHQMELHYGNSHKTTHISVYVDKVLHTTDTLHSDGQYHLYRLSFPSTPSEIHIELVGEESPDFYGITLDAEKGIRMDNVAMRGSSGRFFSRLNTDNFQKMSEIRSADILLFQYGGNAVPYLNDNKEVEKYVTSLIKNIKWVQKFHPNAICFLIGPGDMATSINGQMTTYPILPILNEEMKRQSVQNNIAYWSLFEAMGGKNSIVRWVDEGIGSPDYVHYRPAGTQLISEAFFQCLQDDLLAVD